MGGKSSRQEVEEDEEGPPLEPLPPPTRERMTGVMVRGCRCLELGRFHLEHDHHRDFTRPMCTKCPIFLFVLFRFGVAGYALVFLLYYFIRELTGPVGGKLLIYLETWTYVGMTLYLGLSFTNVSIDLCREYRGASATTQRPGQTPLRYKLQWMFFNISIVSSCVSAITFWVWVGITEVYPTSHIYEVVNLHGILAIVAVVEVGLVTIPLRFEHIVYPLVFGLVYLIFSVIYWAAGGTDAHGHRYIYIYLDYGRKPLRATLVITLVFIVSLVLHSLFMLFFKFKVKLLARCCPVLLGDEEEDIEMMERLDQDSADGYQALK